MGIGTLPDYLSDDSSSLVQLFTDRETPQLEAYFTYAQEMRSVARIQGVPGLPDFEGAALELLSVTGGMTRASLDHK